MKEILEKMDSKIDDILNVDDDLLLCYDLEKLNLDSIPNDILDFTDELTKTECCSDVQNDGEDVNTAVGVNSANDSSENCAPKSSATEDDSKDLTTNKVKIETPSKNIKRKIDINGNEEISSCENLNDLFVKLELHDSETKETDEKEFSDSDNEETGDGELSDSENEEEDEKDSKLTERGGPIRTKRASRRQKDSCTRIENHNIDPQRLRFWSGSSQVQLLQSTNVPVRNSLTPIICGSEVAHSSTTQDYFYEDARVSVSSPESGYDSSAPSITGSPPPLSVWSQLNLDFIPETVDEQNILDFLIENTDSAFINNSFSAPDLNGVDPKGKITEIINFLKDTPEELNKSSSALVGLVEDNTPENVPLVGNARDLNASPVMLPPVLSSPVSRITETPKKLVYKLPDKAKKELQKFLSKNEYHIIRDEIYKRINKDITDKKNVKVIYVVEEPDKKVPEKKTNLHHAVLNANIEQIYSLVEIHKQYGLPLSDINIRDRSGKTALDYAIANEMTLVVDYLIENTACQSVKI